MAINLSKELISRIADEGKRKKMPQWTSPMLATLTHNYFSSEEWIYERKLDGERCLTYVETKNRARLMSRNKKNLNKTYPELQEAMKQAAGIRMIVDGEVVAFDGNVTSFSRLQRRMHDTKSNGSRPAVYYYIFDILYYDKYDVTKLPLRVRKKILRGALSFSDPIRFTSHRNTSGEEYLREACQKGWEGLIAKLADAPYRHSRSKDWLKFKCSKSQEFVVAGFTDPEGERVGLGAILIGYYDDNRLRYAGKVGTGFDDDMLKYLRKKLDNLEQEESPFNTHKISGISNVHWVQPKLVCQAGFTEWTSDGKLRHPRFLGLRRDKNPKKVVREDQ